MSMVEVINTVRKLFNNREEMTYAHERNETLYLAARKFNEAIDDSERRRRERIKRGVSKKKVA